MIFPSYCLDWCCSKISSPQCPKPIQGNCVCCKNRLKLSTFRHILVLLHIIPTTSPLLYNLIHTGISGGQYQPVKLLSHPHRAETKRQLNTPDLSACVCFLSQNIKHMCLSLFLLLQLVVQLKGGLEILSLCVYCYTFLWFIILA